MLSLASPSVAGLPRDRANKRTGLPGLAEEIRPWKFSLSGFGPDKINQC